MADRAVIFTRPRGALPEQQQTACLAYCDLHGYAAMGMCRDLGDAAALVEAGAAAVVVAAYSESCDRPMERRVRTAGGRLEYVRPPAPGARQMVDVEDLIGRMYRGGADVSTIAQLLDQDDEDVRAALRRRRIN